MQVVSEILAFLNSEGGTLLIGIEKNKEICGIERDFEYIMRTNKSHLSPPDQFTLDFKEILQSEIKNYGSALPNINLSLENLPIGKTVCIIDVKKSTSPIFNVQGQLIVNAIGAKKIFEVEDPESSDYISKNF